MSQPAGSTAETDQILARAGIFRGIQPRLAYELTDQLESVDFPRGHTVFVEGEPGDKLYVIIDGKVKIGRNAPDGRENLLTILGQSDMFGELSIFDPGPRTASAIAVTKVRTLSMDRDTLLTWITGRPDLAEQLLGVLACRLRRTNDTLADIIFTDVAGRLAKQLLQLAGRFGCPETRGVRVTHDLTQKEIAQLVGSTRETVNRALSDFVSRGWIQMDGKSVLILKPERLQRRAGIKSTPRREGLAVAVALPQPGPTAIRVVKERTRLPKPKPSRQNSPWTATPDALGTELIAQ